MKFSLRDLKARTWWDCAEGIGVEFVRLAAMKTRIQITNSETGELLGISRDVTTVHPDWVHQQCGTSTEKELQAFLDGLNALSWYSGKTHLGKNDHGIEIFLD